MAKHAFEYEEQQLREAIVKWALSMFNRGYSSGGAGNISARLSDGTLIATPTNSSFGDLEADTLSKVSAEGKLLSGPKATKELAMHLAIYQQRPQAQAVVHLHSPYLTALSCLADLDQENCLPPITPYYVMRIKKLPLITYYKPGDVRLGDEVSRLAADNVAMLLANHGPIISGRSIKEAVFNAEELEDTARLYLQLLPHTFKTLNAEQVAELKPIDI
jgi:ribulose-5-phosphate 4-epimerase/fuculose-1-phosphate aldolase